MPRAPAERTTSSQASLVLIVGAGLVLLNVFLAIAQPHEHPLPRSVRVAKERESGVASAGEAGAPNRGSWFGARSAAGAERAHAGAGASSVRGAAAPATAKRARPSPPPPTDWRTHEHCYAQSDESETCFYHGPLCYDGNHLLVASNHEEGQDARTSMCYDFRHFVASPSCGYNGPHKRANLDVNTELSDLQDRVPRSLSYSSDRRWGPMGREIHYKEISTDVFSDPSAENVTIRWLDGPMYVGGLHHSWLDHTWHFAAASMALFDLKRYNRSLHVDTGLHGATPSSLTPAGAWDAPSMDNLLIAGDYRNVKGLHELRPWIAHLLTMLVQNHTRILWNSIWKEEWGTNKNHWVCSKRGVVIGLKPRMFNSIGDAHVWRMLSYQVRAVAACAAFNCST